MTNKKNRRQQILESLATMLEEGPGVKITTAALAKEVGVSEAALYRHFPSKSKMFEGLIEFVEETIFSRINLIVSEDYDVFTKCEKIIQLLIVFVERNPGITRILTGDALVGETDKLRQRIVQFYDRIETQLKQLLREAELKDGIRFGMSVSDTVNLVVVALEGKIAQYVRSGFKNKPSENWHEQWVHLVRGLTV